MAFFTALALAGLATSVYGQVKSGKAQKAAGNAQQQAANSEADLSDYNAGVADLQAQDALERGQQNEANFRMGVRGMVGSQRAGIAAGNIDVGYGSAVDVQGDTAYLGELDALKVRTNAGREAWGYNVQASDLRAQAAIARKTGVYAQKAGNAAGNAAYVGAAGSLLTGSASLMSDRYGFNNRGTHN